MIGIRRLSTALAVRATRLSAWTAVRAAIAGAAMLLCGIWIAIDRTPPSWDPAHYLDMTEQYLHGWQAGGPGGLRHALDTADPSRGPLFPLAMLPFFAVVGVSHQAGLLVNLALLPVLLLAVAAIGARLADRRAGLIAMLVAATEPLLVGLSHKALVDFLSVTLTVLAVLLMLASDCFLRTRAAAALGAVVALGWLTKVTFLALIIAPLALTLGRAAVTAVTELPDAAHRRRGLRRLANAALTLGLGIGIAALWYVPHLAATLDYVRSATGGALAIGAGPDHNFDLGAAVEFSLRFLNNEVTWVVALVLVGAGLLVVPTWVRAALRRPWPAWRDDVWRAAFLVSWAAVPWVSVAMGRDHDPRNAVASVPAIAVLLGCLVSAVRWRGARGVLTATVGSAGIALTLLTMLPPIRGLPDRWAVSTPAGFAVIPVDAAVVGYEVRPQGRDDATPVIEYLEAMASRRPRAGPLGVGVAQEHPSINPNTLGWVADSRGDSMIVSDPPAGPDVIAQLDAELAPIDVMLYIAPPRSSGKTRTDLLNQSTTSVVLGDRLFSIFSGSRRAFLLDDGQTLWVLGRSA